MTTSKRATLTKQQIHKLPALYTFTADGARIRKSTAPAAQPVDWSALAEEAALPLEPVTDDEIFAVKR